MELSDTIPIKASRDKVYHCLNDTEILKQCIPGCNTLIKETDTHLIAVIIFKIGPIKMKLNGTITLDPFDAPKHFTLIGEGSGGIAGFAKGRADIQLVEQEDNTLLHYKARADIGGKLAKLGSSLVAKTALKLSRNFFERFNQAIIKNIDDA